MMIRSKITGWGGYLPEKVVTNDDLSQNLDTTHEWIHSRTGIAQRHLAAEDEFTSDLATAAARKALDQAGIASQDLDLIIVATTTPDETFPSTAAIVQRKLGTHGCGAFDLQAVCTGFVYALSVADNFIKTGSCKNVLVIGAETFSRILDWEDRRTCVLFGDGAGAVVLSRSEGEGNLNDSGIFSSHLHADGRQHDILYVDGGPSSTQTVGKVRMLGTEVFKQAVSKMASSIKECLEFNKMTVKDIDWMIPHQANQRIFSATAKATKFPIEKMISTVGHHANTSAASVPLALAESLESGKIKSGDMVMLIAMGGGFTWGVSLLRI
jgi:3-oxoacyl-[acyl-carrier-protein] synthase-3